MRLGLQLQGLRPIHLSAVGRWVPLKSSPCAGGISKMHCQRLISLR